MTMNSIKKNGIVFTKTILENRGDTHILIFLWSERRMKERKNNLRVGLLMVSWNPFHHVNGIPKVYLNPFYPIWHSVRMPFWNKRLFHKLKNFFCFWRERCWQTLLPCYYVAEVFLHKIIRDDKKCFPFHKRLFLEFFQFLNHSIYRVYNV